MPWRPRHEGDFPTLGWTALEWTYAYLPSPADEKQPLVYTDEQARWIVDWYRIDPDLGEFVYDRARIEMAKGWGKSPFVGSLEWFEFAGPCRFDGWDAYGQPVGAPWG